MTVARVTGVSQFGDNREPSWLGQIVASSSRMPYRMLLFRRKDGKKLLNLLIAGRCASMTHDGQSAARVSGACFVMGEAAGAAAAIAVRNDVAVSEIDPLRLQNVLRNQGAFLGDA
jgi:hypothetical protein